MPALATMFVNVPRRTISAGMPLFHGSRCAGGFTMPDGPAWFAFDILSARKWCDWFNIFPTDKSGGFPGSAC